MTHYRAVNVSPFHILNLEISDDIDSTYHVKKNAHAADGARAELVKHQMSARRTLADYTTQMHARLLRTCAILKRIIKLLLFSTVSQQSTNGARADFYSFYIEGSWLQLGSRPEAFHVLWAAISAMNGTPMPN